MKNYKYKFFIFIASLIIGFLASNNFNINSMSNLFKMNAQEYKNASNSYRILNNTGVTCNWAFIGFEDESMEMAPFYFYAIGNPEQLETAIKAEGSYINELIIRKLKVEINVMESITVLPTKKSYDSLYMHRNDK